MRVLVAAVQLLQVFVGGVERRETPCRGVLAPRALTILVSRDHPLRLSLRLLRAAPLLRRPNLDQDPLVLFIW